MSLCLRSVPGQLTPELCFQTCSGYPSSNDCKTDHCCQTTHGRKAVDGSCKTAHCGLEADHRLDFKATASPFKATLRGCSTTRDCNTTRDSDSKRPTADYTA